MGQGHTWRARDHTGCQRADADPRIFYFRSIYQTEHPRDWNIKSSDQEPSRPYSQNQTSAPAPTGAESIGAQVAKGHTATSTAQSEQNNPNANQSGMPIAQGLSAIVAVLVTIVIAAINFCQWGVYNRQANIMMRQLAIARASARAAQTSANTAKQTLISTQRAFVFLDDFYVDQGNMGHVVKPQWRNSGKTPPKEMIINVNWRCIEGELRGNSHYTYSSGGTRMFIGPEAQEWSAPIPIPLTIVNDINRRHRIAYFWGRVDYLDIFDDTKAHFTEWCYRIYVVPGQLNWQFVAYGGHNRSD